MNTLKDKTLLDLEENHYPKDFLAFYEPIECLSFNLSTETLYVKHRLTGQYAVAKCYTGKTLLQKNTENHILHTLRHPGLPALIDEYENETMLCVVREYIPGVTLADAIAKGPLPQQQAVSILTQLCDILTYLHGQSPPIIHRDIKPQNIILAEDGTAKLIDFGISRMHDPNAVRDTVFYGTQEYAPPEQYGFAQTDGRSDVFSLGIVMGALLTAQASRAEAEKAIQHKRLLHIYRKSTDFSPSRRYASAAQMKTALLHTNVQRQQWWMRLDILTLACFLCLLGGFSLGRYTNLLSLSPNTLSFIEPMIEKAVRLQLGREPHEPITAKDALAVTELYLFGNEVITKTEEEMDRAANGLLKTGRMKTGPIHTLADLTQLPNLQRVSVAMQQVSDLKPLAALPQLEVLVIKNNPIEDIAPLSGLKRLYRLSAFGILVKDFTVLATCPNLATLDAGGTLAQTPADFFGLNSLTDLYIHRLTLDTLNGIDTLRKLQYIDLYDVRDGDLSPLLSVPFLQNILLEKALRPAAEKIQANAHFTINYR